MNYWTTKLYKSCILRSVRTALSSMYLEQKRNARKSLLVSVTLLRISGEHILRNLPKFSTGQFKLSRGKILTLIRRPSFLEAVLICPKSSPRLTYKWEWMSENVISGTRVRKCHTRWHVERKYTCVIRGNHHQAIFLNLLIISLLYLFCMSRREKF